MVGVCTLGLGQTPTEVLKVEEKFTNTVHHFLGIPEENMESVYRTEFPNRLALHDSFTNS